MTGKVAESPARHAPRVDATHGYDEAGEGGRSPGSMGLAGSQPAGFNVFPVHTSTDFSHCFLITLRILTVPSLLGSEPGCSPCGGDKRGLVRLSVVSLNAVSELNN